MQADFLQLLRHVDPRRSGLEHLVPAIVRTLSPDPALRPWCWGAVVRDRGQKKRLPDNDNSGQQVQHPTLPYPTQPCC